MATPLTLAKKTKTELLEEYNKLLAEHEDLRRTAQLIADPQSIALISKVEGYTADQLTRSIGDLESSVNATLRELGDKLIAEAQKFGELQKAIELAKKNLDLHYRTQVAADTLDRLIAEHKTKTLAFDEEIAAKNRDWVREQEEHEYAVKTRNRRVQDEFEELKIRQDRLLKEREELLKRQEQEAQELRKKAEEFPKQLEYALREREQEVSKRLGNEFDAQTRSAQKDWGAAENVYKLRMATLEDQSKKQSAEIVLLRGEVEKANKRVQEFAVKIIEGGTKVSAKDEDQTVKASIPHPL